MTGCEPQEASSGAPSLLLLHGAYHDARIWSRLRGHLDELGVLSLAPTLDLEDPSALDEAADAISGPFFIVAHSLAGALVGEWLARDASKTGSLSGVAHLASYIPRPGQSVTQLVKLDRGSAVPALLRRTPSQDCVELNQSAVREVLYNDAPAGLDLSPFLQGLHPQRTAAFSRPRAAPPPGSSLPKHLYVICRRDRAITPALQRLMAADARCDQTLELDAGHMPMVTCPQALLRLLLSAWPELLRVRT